MCKSKADGGKRCFSHTVKDRASLDRQIATQLKLISFLKEREEKAGQLTLPQKNELAQRTEKISQLTERAEGLDSLLAQMKKEEEEAAALKEERAVQKAEQAVIDAENRIKRGTQGSGSGRPRLNLTPKEMTDLKERAIAQGKSVSRYVQDLTDEPPIFRAKLVDSKFKRIQAVDDRGLRGRKPQSSQGSTISSSPTAGMSAEKYDRLTAEAEAFGLTTADYLRRRILGQDPRTRGAHMSMFRQDAEIAYLQKTEEESGLTSHSTTKQIWSAYSELADRIQAERKNSLENSSPMSA